MIAVLVLLQVSGYATFSLYVCEQETMTIKSRSITLEPKLIHVEQKLITLEKKESTSDEMACLAAESEIAEEGGCFGSCKWDKDKKRDGTNSSLLVS